MTPKEKALARAERINKVAKWQDRLDTLATRKKKPKSEARFCADHGIEKTYFNRVKRLEVTPKDDKVEAVEKALAEEGV